MCARERSEIARTHPRLRSTQTSSPLFSTCQAHTTHRTHTKIGYPMSYVLGLREPPVRCTCTSHLRESHARATCTNQLRGSPARATCGSHLCEPPVRATCASHLRESPVRVTCASHLREAPVRATCTRGRSPEVPPPVPGFRVIIVHIAVACGLMRQQQGPLPLGPCARCLPPASRRGCARDKAHPALRASIGTPQTRT